MVSRDVLFQQVKLSGLMRPHLDRMCYRCYNLERRNVFKYNKYIISIVPRQEKVTLLHCQWFYFGLIKFTQQFVRTSKKKNESLPLTFWCHPSFGSTLIIFVISITTTAAVMSWKCVNPITLKEY